MSICEICGREHPNPFSLLITEDEGKSVCATCFLLAQPSYNQLKHVSAEDIRMSKYPSLNMYLYQKLCEVYDMPLFNETRSSQPAAGKKRNSQKSKENSAMTNLSNIPPEPFFGREKDIQNTFNILGRKNKRNPIILGPAGTGKTAIVYQIARMVRDGAVPEFLKDKEIFELNVSQLVAGTKYRGELEEKFNNILTDFESKNAILFIDDISSITSVGGSTEDSLNVAGLLRPFINSNKVQVIGTSTIEDYRRTIESNKSLSRLFQPVYIEEQPVPEIMELMQVIAPEIAAFHGVTVSSETVEDCVNLADQYIKYRCFPDKAIDLLDMACSRKKSTASSTAASSQAVTDIMNSSEVAQRLNSLPCGVDLVTIFIGSPEVKKNLAECSVYIQNIFDNLEEEGSFVGTDSFTITRKDLSEVVEFWTKIPVRNMSKDYKTNLKAMAPSIKQAVIGQDEAVEAVTAAICRRKLGISKSKRPASFIFVGETGVGKTELAKAITKSMFGSESKMIRFDMSEYMESHSVSKLIGAPPGYVGYNEAGQLTEALRRNPFSVVLFDEIEKAHHDVSNILLQVLDDGRITDAKGEVIDASNAIIILTSNAGANMARGLGFTKGGVRDEETFKKGLMSAFRPEFLGRVDSIVTFNNLTDDNYKEIAKLYVEKIVKNLSESDIELTYSDSVLSALCAKSNTNKYHAREIARTVTKYIEDAIASAVLESDDEDTVETIRLITDNDDIKVLINKEVYSMS